MSIPQRKALRIISFQPRDVHSSPLFKKHKLLKFEVNTLIIYYHQFLTSRSHFVLINIIIKQLPPLQINYSSPHSKFFYMEKNSTIISAVYPWNKIQTAFEDVILKNLATIHIEILLTKKYIDKY